MADTLAQVIERALRFATSGQEHESCLEPCTIAARIAQAVEQVGYKREEPGVKTDGLVKTLNEAGHKTVDLSEKIKAGAGKYRVWACKIVVPADVELPSGFDAPPRGAAQQAVEDAGIEVLGCFSGWAGSLTEGERKVLEGDD